jgi:hypothetical protein
MRTPAFWTGGFGAGIWPRLLATALGAWLLASAFLWPHDATDGLDAVMLGLLVLTVAPMSIWAPRLRFGTLVLGAWLVFDGLVFEHPVLATGWNHLLVGGALCVLALVPSPPRLVVPDEAEAPA